jgi:O-succinylbenzoic acid--CoA ligase
VYQIRCPLREAGTIGKNQVGLICPEGRLTFYEYDQAVSATAQELKAQGIRAGDRVTLAALHGWQQPILFFAALRAGAIACPSEHKATGADLTRDMEAIASRHVVLEMAGAQTASGPRHVESAEVVKLALPLTEDGLDFAFDGNRPAIILFSGRAAARRAILHSYSSVYYGALASNVTMDLRTNDRWLIMGAIHRMEVLGAVFDCAVSGATLVMGDRERSLAENVLMSGATHAFVSPGDLEELIGSERLGECRLKMALVMEPVEEALLREARRAGIGVHACYAVPEVASLVSVVTRCSPPSKLGTSGVAMRYCDVRVADDGRIQVRGRALFDGYVSGQDVTPGTDASGWFTTGDYGSLDAEGYLTVTRRG